MTSIVSTEFTREVNLRHFFVPLEVVPRTMTDKMTTFDWRDNPVSSHFRRDPTENAQNTNFGP
jgi:hypothetical protein